jgi:hypothetical protein
LEGPKDNRSTGGHGNQHVRLRSAQIDLLPMKRSARLDPEPRQTSLLMPESQAGSPRPASSSFLIEL